MSEIFVSYSRRDTEFVHRLVSALGARSIEVWVDVQDIPPASRFADEVKSAIEGANTFGFVMSPDSLASVECARELAHAASLNKRIIPIHVRQCDLGSVPDTLAALNFVPQIGLFDDDFEAALGALVDAITTDLDWVRAHTSLGQKAIEWNGHDRDRSFLLSGSELEAAESWLAGRSDKSPEPTELQATFVLESRRRATRRLRQTRSLVSVALVVALILSTVALLERNTAVSNQHQAQSQEMSAEATTLFSTDAPVGMLVSMQAYARYPTLAARDALIEAAEQPLESSFETGSMVQTAALSANGEFLAAGGGRTVTVWDTRSDKIVGSISVSGKKNNIVKIAFSPNDETLAIGDAYGDVTLWSATTRKAVTHRYAPAYAGNGGITSIAFSPNGQLFAVGDAIGNLGLWNATDFNFIYESRHVTKNGVASLAFSPNSQTLAVGFANTAGVTDDLVASVNVSTGGTIARWSEGAEVSSVAFSPDGSTLAVGDQSGHIGLWDWTNGRRIATLTEGRPLNSLAFSPNGQTLAAGDVGDVINLWDPATTKPIGTLAEGSPVETLAYSPNGQTLVAGDGGGRVDLWSAAGARSTTTTLAEGSAAHSVAYSRDGKILAVGDDSGHVTLWDAASGQKMAFSEGAAADSIAFSPNGRTLAVGDAGGDIRLWDLTTLHPIHKLVEGRFISSVAFSPNGQTLAAGTIFGANNRDGNVVLWNFATGKTITLREPSGVHSVAYSPDGKILAVGDQSPDLDLWRTANDRRLSSLPEGKPVHSLAFSPDGATLAAGDTSGHVGLWDVATKQRIATLAEGSPASSVAFSPNGQIVAVGDQSGLIGIWDRANGQLTSTLSDGSSVQSVAFSRNGQILAAGDTSNNVKLFQSVLWTDGLTAFSRIVCGEVRANMTSAQWTANVPDQPYQKSCTTYP